MEYTLRVQQFIKIGRDIYASNPKIQSFDCEQAPGDIPEQDVDYVGYTARHLFQHVAEHKNSAIVQHLHDAMGRSDLVNESHFKILRDRKSVV